MTAYRFRVKLDPDPTSLWRDVVIGGERTVDEFQAAFNRSVGLGRDHLWFVGAGEEYWRSDVKYQCPLEFEELPGGSIRPDEEVYNAEETTIDGMVGRPGLAERDRICYLFDYGDEWRFYAILKEVLRDESGDRAPEVVKEKGDPVEQYHPPTGRGRRSRNRSNRSSRTVQCRSTTSVRSRNVRTSNTSSPSEGRNPASRAGWRSGSKTPNTCSNTSTTVGTWQPGSNGAKRRRKRRSVGSWTRYGSGTPPSLTPRASRGIRDSTTAGSKR
ncbi:IS1096 element passenger TnpR family protein [Natronorarus salvus]|uniref:IS1096 element passenger TnpR family protein n=1 Tax=Natronorarus salvus TaxID=3117733 RepID=UPI002F2691EB